MSAVAKSYVLSEHIRLPSEQEVEFFRENGWAFLPQLVSGELAEEILRRIKQLIDFDYDELPPDVAGNRNAGFTGKSFASNTMLRMRDDLLKAFVESRELGELAAALTGIRPMRLTADTVIYKLPQRTGAGDATAWHQDMHNFPIEPKAGAVQTWLALCDISTDMGGMLHLSGSHKEGPVIESNDSTSNEWSLEEFLAEFPQMRKYPISEPREYHPGDALVHDGLCAHGAPPNKTNTVRWAYASYRVPATTRYVGHPRSAWLESLGLELGKPMDHPLLPIVVD